MLKQQVQIIFDKVSTHQRPVGFLPTLHEAIQPAIVVDPSKSAFYFPALPTIAFLLAVLGWSPFRDADMVLAIGNNRNDPPLAQGAPQGFTVVPFIQPQPLGPPQALTHANAINGFQNINLVIPIGSTQREVQGMPMRLDDDMPFET